MCLSIALAAGARARAAEVETFDLPFDAAQTIEGVEVACTGIGQTRLEPRWRDWPVRVEFSNASNLYLADGEVVLSTARGRPIVGARCAGPWILFRLPPGDYRVTGRLPGLEARPRSAVFSSPGRAPMRIVLQFTDVAD